MKKLLAIIVACTLLCSLSALAVAEGPQGKNVSLLTANLSSVTTNQMIEFMKAGLEAQGVTVTVVDTKGDFGQLASRIEDSVSSKADAIVLVSADPGLVATQLQTAFDAKVPVFGCDSGYMEGMQVNATSDNYKMGEDIARYLFEDLMGGKGTVIALTHRPHPGVAKRCQAFDDLIKQYPDIKLITEQHVEVPGPIDSARTIMENLILANSAKDSVTAVWCAWDEPAIGVTQALTDAGRSEVIVTGVDGNSQAVALIDEGSNLKATMAQNFEGLANIVVTEIVKLFNGETVVPGDQYAPAVLITKK